LPAEAPLRALVVDDEELARRGLRRDLLDLGGIEVVGECADGFEAVKAAAEQKPDLIFLDIRMPRLDGFEVLSLLDPGIAVVFVTAHDDRAVHAFDANAVDYVMKPVDPERLARAVERARERLRRREPLPLAAIGAAARAPGEPLSRILVKDGSRVHVIPVDDVDSIEAQDDYIAVQAAGKTHLKQQTIGELEAALDPRRFVRIHRSWILNLDRLDRIELYAKDSRVAILKDGRRLPLSRAGHQRLRELL
jgi:two-component system LytT family response regulator